MFSGDVTNIQNICQPVKEKEDIGGDRYNIRGIPFYIITKSMRARSDWSISYGLLCYKARGLLRLVIYKFFSCSTNISRGLSAYNPWKLVVYCLNMGYTCICMCGPKGYGLRAILVINRVSCLGSGRHTSAQFL